MKILFLVSIALFLLGFFFKLEHWPMSGVLLLLGSLLLYIHSLIYLIKNGRRDTAVALLYLSIAALTNYVLVRVQFWPWAGMISLFALIVTISCFVIHVLKKVKFGIPQYLVLIYFGFFLYLNFVPAYDLYYYIHLNNQQDSEMDYWGWDHYSWFLNQAGKHEEALEANAKALQTTEKCLKDGGYGGVEEYAEKIKRHGEMLKAGTWEEIE